MSIFCDRLEERIIILFWYTEEDSGHLGAGWGAVRKSHCSHHVDLEATYAGDRYLGLGLRSDREEAVVSDSESHAIIPKESMRTSKKPPRNMGIS